MADQHGLFWNSESSDRVYDADSFSEWLRKFFTTGVFAGELFTTATSGMGISVSAGYCNIDGKVRFFDTASTFTLSAANSTYPRIDTVVIERNDTNREITMKVVTGLVSGTTPSPTAPVRSGGVYQLVVAQVLVKAGATSISNEDITDTRMDSTVCGYVTGTVSQINFDQITAQWTDYIENFESDQQAAFEAWFEDMKDQLSEDAAGHLQLEIDALDDRIDGLGETLQLDVLGPFEGGDNATAAHELGDYFIWKNDYLAVATTAIAIGDTIYDKVTTETITEAIESIRSALNTLSNVVSGHTTTLASHTSTLNTHTSQINSLKNLVEVFTYSKSGVSIGANSSSGAVNISCSRSGYTLVGIIGISKSGTSSSFCFPYDWYVSGSTAVVYLRNTTSSSTTLKVEAQVLMRKNNI